MRKWCFTLNVPGSFITYEKGKVNVIINYQINTLLEKNEMPVKKIHGSMEQKERNNVMKDFRNGNTRYLVTTNLLARGIDIQNLGIVINYDFLLPNF